MRGADGKSTIVSYPHRELEDKAHAAKVAEKLVKEVMIFITAN